MIDRLFDRLGGAAELGAAVNLLHARLVSDERVSHRFQGDVRRTKRHQRGFLTVAVGGEDAYYGLDLTRLHGSLGITRAEFEVMTHHLRAVLDELMVDDEDIDEIMTEVTRLRPQVVQA